MIKEFQAVWDVFHEGKAVANPALWKTNKIKGDLVVLISALVTIAGGFGYNITLSQETITALSGGFVAIYTVYSAVMTVITTDKIGIKPKGGL